MDREIIKRYITDTMLWVWYAGDYDLESIYYYAKKDHNLCCYSEFVDAFLELVYEKIEKG